MKGGSIDPPDSSAQPIPGVTVTASMKGGSIDPPDAEGGLAQVRIGFGFNEGRIN